ncbi:DUF3531 domain-containing protein [Tanacetum coccineum]
MVVISAFENDQNPNNQGLCKDGSSLTDGKKQGADSKSNNVELRNVLGDTIGNPDQMRLKVEDRIRKKGRDFHKPKTSVVAFKVTFRDFSPVGSNIWFKLYGPPSDPDVDLIGTVIQSWYIREVIEEAYNCNLKLNVPQT